MTYKTLMSPKENPTENNSTFINLDDELRNRIILNKTISYDVIRHICQLDSVTEDMRVQLDGQ